METLQHLPREEVDGGTHRRGSLSSAAPGGTGFSSSRGCARSWRRRRPVLPTARHTRPGAPGCGRARSARPRAHRRARAGRGSGIGSTSASPARASAPPTKTSRRSTPASTSSRPAPSNQASCRERCKATARTRRRSRTEGGLFVPLGAGEPTHPRLERSEEPVRGLEGGEEIPDELSVALGVDRAVARCGATADVREDTRGEARPVRPSIGVQRRRGTISSNASFARRAVLRTGERPEAGCSRRRQRPGERP